MVREKKSNLIMMVIGMVIILFTIIMQITHNIIGKNMELMLVINIVFIIIVYNFFSCYKLQKNDEIAQKNKLLMIFAMTLELILFCGFIVEIRFRGIGIVSFCILSLMIFLSYVVNIWIFTIDESCVKLKNIVLCELIIIYSSTIVIAANWVFFVCLPMLALCTIYGEDKLLKLVGIILNIITLVLAIRKVLIMDESENPVLYGGIYMAILAIYIVFFVCVVDTSNMIGIFNTKKIEEILAKQKVVKELSENVISESKEIRKDVSKTNIIVDDLEKISRKSSEIFDDIAFKNIENSNCVEVQRQMTTNINNLIDDVKVEVEYAVNSTISSNERLKESNESVLGIKEKSSNIIDGNKEVMKVFEELIFNIKSIKKEVLN